ncbi:MAG: ABC transporter permease [Muribaculaceae bacterium]|nr:ABC transporter permease [Muribaculaceae bacterium]
MQLPISARIAWRYLISKKSHGAVATITTVSIIAMAIATAALVCVLSVFNGFRDVIGSRLDTLLPDLILQPAEGKSITDADNLTLKISQLPGVTAATPVLEDNALAVANSQELPIKVKGVNPEEYARVTDIKKIIPDDYGSYFTDSLIHSVASIGVASRLGLLPESGIFLFVPRREGRVNMANPAASFTTDSLTISGVYRSNQSQFDTETLLIPLDRARRLFDREEGASSIEIALGPTTDPNSVIAEINRLTGGKYIVKDRLRQQEVNFRMVEIEKWISYLLLGFILLIASFNIISSLSMLVIEKQSGLASLHALGMSTRRIGDVFAWESFLVSLSGGVSGIILGVAICLLQRQFGLIKIGGNPDTLIVNAYPVIIEWLDLAATMVPILVIGLLTALLTAAFARRSVKS